jgi:hypothetical protein
VASLRESTGHEGHDADDDPFTDLENGFHVQSAF